jgi:hypothetical protein
MQVLPEKDVEREGKGEHVSLRFIAQGGRAVNRPSPIPERAAPPRPGKTGEKLTLDKMSAPWYTKS